MTYIRLAIKGDRASAHAAAHARKVPLRVILEHADECFAEVPRSEAILNRVMEWYAEPHEAVLPAGSLLLFSV